MTGVSLTIDLDTLPQAALTEILARARDLHEPLDAAGARLLTSVQLRFERGIGPDGQRWPMSKAALARGGQTLIAKGHLRDSVIYEANATSVSIGTNQVYAAIHQFGGQAGRNHALTLPARPYLGLDEDDTAILREEIEDWLAGAWS